MNKRLRWLTTSRNEGKKGIAGCDVKFARVFAIVRNGKNRWHKKKKKKKGKEYEYALTKRNNA